MDNNILRLIIRCVKGIASALEQQLHIQVKKKSKDKEFEDINAQSD